MDITGNLKIGGHNITTEFATSATINNLGEFNTYHQQIRLRKEDDIPEDAVAEAFLHEIIEAIKHFNNLDISHKDLTIISEGLFQVIRDNKLRFDE